MEYIITIADDQNTRLALAIGNRRGLDRPATPTEIKDAIIGFLKTVTGRFERTEQLKTVIVPPAPIEPQ